MSLSNYLQGFIFVRWRSPDFWTINSMIDLESLGFERKTRVAPFAHKIIRGFLCRHWRCLNLMKTTNMLFGWSTGPPIARLYLHQCFVWSQSVVSCFPQVFFCNIDSQNIVGSIWSKNNLTRNYIDLFPQKHPWPSPFFQTNRTDILQGSLNYQPKLHAFSKTGNP